MQWLRSNQNKISESLPTARLIWDERVSSPKTDFLSGSDSLHRSVRRFAASMRKHGEQKSQKQHQAQQTIKEKWVIGGTG
jgi:hypothetical protein